MANDCGYTASSFQDIADILCTLDTNAQTRYQSLLDAINVVLHDVAVDAGSPDTLFRVATQVRTRLGDPGGSSNIDAKLNTLLSDETGLASAVSTIDDKIGTPPDGWPTLVDLTYDFNAQRSVANIAQETFQSVYSGGHSVSDILGSIVANVFGGGSALVELGKVVQQIWDAPPLEVLSESGYTALSAQTTLTIPAGVYGYVLEFTVPGYWGQLSADPIVYQPHIAVAAWRGDFGTVGPVVLLATPASQVYPRPPGAKFLDITLRPGISGRYHELRFLGL